MHNTKLNSKYLIMNLVHCSKAAVQDNKIVSLKKEKVSDLSKNVKVGTK